MKQIAGGVAVMVIICGAALTAASQNAARSSADTNAAAKDAVVKLENLWLANEGNPVELESILADDFVHVLPIGTITKKEHISFVKQHPWPKMKEHKFENLQVRVYGNVAIANGCVLAVPENGTARRTYFTDVFALRGGRWQAVNAQESEAANTTNP